MENAGIFYGNLEYFTVIWYIFGPFGYVVVVWYIFHRFGILCQEKSGNPGPGLAWALGLVSKSPNPNLGLEPEIEPSPIIKCWLHLTQHATGHANTIMMII
jgi:hypothetical protein